MEYYEKNGKIAVLVSGGFGAGWSTWNYQESEGRQMSELKCPCSLRDYMEEADCRKTLCCDCCPLQKKENDDA